MAKNVMVGLSLLIWTGFAGAAEYAQNSQHGETLPLVEGVYMFTEHYSFTDDDTLGNWAGKAYQYRRVNQQGDLCSTAISLPVDPSGSGSDPAWVVYRFIIPAGNTAVWFSTRLRCGSAIRVAPELAQLNDASALLATGADTGAEGWIFKEYSGAIPSSRLKTAVPGQTSFFLKVLNEGNYQSVAGIDSLTLTAIPPAQGVVSMVVRPISSNIRVPDQMSPDGVISSQITITAAQGEYEPASFVTYVLDDFNSVQINKTDLTKTGGSSIAASEIDIKVVKCWYQAGTAWVGIDQDKSRKVLIPELLLNDEKLVNVDTATRTNYLKLFGMPPRYIDITDPTELYHGVSPWVPAFSTITEFPIYDSSALRSVDLERNKFKQFWITVHIPPGTRHGTYNGQITLARDGQTLKTLPLCVNVLPFTLLDPKTYYDHDKDFECGLYVTSIYDSASQGSISAYHRTEAQIKAELADLAKHNVTNPICEQKARTGDDMDALFRVLQWRTSIAGMKTEPLYLLDADANLCAGLDSSPESLARVRRKVINVLDAAEVAFGHRNVYFYGWDEASGDTLAAEIPIWEAIHAAGGKVFASANVGSVVGDVGDILDTGICALPPTIDVSSAWHAYGQKVWCYAQPSGGVEDPELMRRNYGLKIYKCNYDGAAPFAYYSALFGNPWNDFDSPNYRDHAMVYPTANGVIDTLAWEGYCEALDDIKYATTLMKEIDRVQAFYTVGTTPYTTATAGQIWFENISPTTCDLDEVRAGMIDRIMALRNFAGIPGATEYTDSSLHSETLSLVDGVYTFSEDYHFTDNGTLGNWASKTYQYSRVDQCSTLAPGAISIPVNTGTEAGMIIYHFSIPAGNVTVDYSVRLREGAAIRAAPEMDELGNTLALLARGDHIDNWGFTTCIGTIPSSQLNTSVPGQTSFFLKVLNEGNYQSAAGIDQLTIFGAITQIPGDANGDGKVDVSDLGILAANYGLTGGATWKQGDFNQDGKIDVGDLGILAANYGSGTVQTLDFNADANALGLAVQNPDDAPASSGLNLCQAAGLPLLAGVLLAAGSLGGFRLKPD